MGVRKRLVQQTITEYVCDLCKKEVSEGDAQVGSLTVKTAGARGRPRQVEVAFHGGCLRKITGTTRKARGAQSKAAKKPSTRRPKSGKKTGKRRAKSTAGNSASA